MKKRTTTHKDYQKSVKQTRKRLRHYFISKKEQKEFDTSVFGWNHGLFNVDTSVLIASVAFFSYCAKCLDLPLGVCRLLFYLASKGIERTTTVEEYRKSLDYFDSPTFPVTYCNQTKALIKKKLIERVNRYEVVITPYALYLLEQFKKDFYNLSTLRDDFGT